MRVDAKQKNSRRSWRPARNKGLHDELVAKLFVASRAGLARHLQLSANRLPVAVMDRRQQLAGFDDEMLLGVEKAIDVVPAGGRRASFAWQLRQLASRGKIAGMDLASVTAFIAASSAAVCSPSPLAKSPIWASEARIVRMVACRAGTMLSA